MDLPPIDWHFFFVSAGKILGAYVLSMPTGWWSEKEGHAVGVRTFPLVSMASCAYLLILGNITSADSLAANSRVLQGLVAGIGFVGGGAIVKAGMSVRGTATAASIWNMGAIGSAVALGRYEVAVILAVMNLLTLGALAPLKKQLDRGRKRRLEVGSDAVKPRKNRPEE
jgi:putative Mg2+ transporter-C (MgtC) family protein